MKISTKSRYGLRAMIFLARLENISKPISIKAISKELRVSQKYLSSILKTLQNRGLVKSVRGKQGGYYLAKKPEMILAWDIVTAVDGEIKLIDCLNEALICDMSDDCVARIFWNRISKAIIEILSETTLKNIVDGTDHHQLDI